MEYRRSRPGDLNPEPTVYDTVALPLSYVGIWSNCSIDSRIFLLQCFGLAPNIYSFSSAPSVYMFAAFHKSQPLLSMRSAASICMRTFLAPEGRPASASDS